MKKYDISDNFRYRVHTIRVTFQCQEYKGHIAYEVGGNCRGIDVLDVDFDLMDDRTVATLKENDCSLQFDEYGVWTLVLKDDEGNTLQIDGLEEDNIRDYVVSLEIIDCRLQENS